MSRLRSIRLAVVLLLLVPAARAGAATDPGRWRHSNTTTLPKLQYYQGMAHGPGGRVFFDGIRDGLFRTNQALEEQTAIEPAIPASVTAAVGFNHIGDIDFDRFHEGGRVLLPLECYDPTKSPSNTCDVGGIAVADPGTLAWKYWVELDPATLPKAMWVAASPDGSELYTSSGPDINVYDLNAVTAANAAPTGAPLKPTRVLAGAVPPSGITGAVFFGGRLLLAGQGASAHQFQVWSVDPRVGKASLRLEIAAPWGGESEGLDTVNAFGGVLHWMIMPIPTDGSQPTFPGKATLVSYEAIGSEAVGATSTRVRLSPAFRARLAVRRSGAVRLVLKRIGRRAGRRPEVRRVAFRLDGKRLRTDRRAPFTARVKPRKVEVGRHRLSATVRLAGSGTRTVRARFAVQQ